MTTPSATAQIADSAAAITRNPVVDALLSGHDIAPPSVPAARAVSPPVLRTRRERREQMRTTMRDSDRLQCLPELHAPSSLPHGNVGTSERMLRSLIAQCRVPTSVIKQLGLRTRPARPYAQVPPPMPPTNEDDDDQWWPAEEEADEHVKRPRAGDGDGSSEADTAPIELTWQKGGAGIVLYTNEQYWDPMRGGDDDSASVLPAPPPRAPHAEAAAEGARVAREFGGFEQHTTGIGGRILKNMGWVQGEGIGQRQGRPEPLLLASQTNRRGVGFVRGARVAVEYGSESDGEVDPLEQMGYRGQSIEDEEDPLSMAAVRRQSDSGVGQRRRRQTPFVPGDVLHT
jgi:hypothetical protein